MLLVVGMEKAWSPESRQAAAEARKAKGGKTEDKPGEKEKKEKPLTGRQIYQQLQREARDQAKAERQNIKKGSEYRHASREERRVARTKAQAERLEGQRATNDHPYYTSTGPRANEPHQFSPKTGEEKAKDRAAAREHISQAIAQGQHVRTSPGNFDTPESKALAQKYSDLRHSWYGLRGQGTRRSSKTLKALRRTGTHLRHVIAAGK